MPFRRALAVTNSFLNFLSFQGSMAKKFGSALLRMGAKKGDVLGMVVPNIPEFPIAFLGAAGVGITITTMNPTYRPGGDTNLEQIIRCSTVRT